MLTNISLAKKSFYNFISCQFTGTSYTIGSGESDLKIMEEYPLLPTGFGLPTVAIDVERIDFSSNYDLGNEAKYNWSFSVNVYARNNLEREYLSGIVLESLEDHMVPLYNYNSASEELITNMRTVDLTGGVIRVETPADEQKYRFSILAVLEILLDYK